MQPGTLNTLRNEAVEGGGFRVVSTAGCDDEEENSPGRIPAKKLLNILKKDLRTKWVFPKIGDLLIHPKQL